MPDELRRTFDRAAQLYDRARPGYPSGVYDDLTAIGALTPDARVLEIGPGTGQATRGLVARGARVTAVELGPALAAVLSSHAWAAAVDVHVGAFEEFSSSEPFDAVLAFTCWHWLAAPERTERAAALLRPAGHLVTVSTTHVRGGTTAFFEDVQDCYDRWDTDPRRVSLPEPAEVAPVVDEVAESPYFSLLEPRRHVQEISYSASSYCDVLRTYSGHIALPPDRLEGLLGCVRALIDGRYGGRISKAYLHEVRVARRGPGPFQPCLPGR